MKYSKKVSDFLGLKGLKKKKNLRQAETRVAFYQAPRLNKLHVYQNSTG